MIKNVDLSEDDELIKQLTENTERAEAGVVDKGGSLMSSKKKKNMNFSESKAGLGGGETRKSNIDEIITRAS